MSNRAIIEGVIEHVRNSISASLELELYGYLAFAGSFLICCYEVCTRLQNTGRRSRRHTRLGTTLFRQRRARQHTVLVILLSQLVFLATLKAPRREWVRPRYVVHSVSAHCGHTIFVRFWYWIETATVLTVLARQGEVVQAQLF